jgi:hypothetical protein
MIATAVYLLDALRRAFAKTGHWLSVLAESFDEALEQSRNAHRKYPFTVE